MERYYRIYVIVNTPLIQILVAFITVLVTRLNMHKDQEKLLRYSKQHKWPMVLFDCKESKRHQILRMLEDIQDEYDLNLKITIYPLQDVDSSKYN